MFVSSKMSNISDVNVDMFEDNSDDPNYIVSESSDSESENEIYKKKNQMKRMN